MILKSYMAIIKQWYQLKILPTSPEVPEKRHFKVKKIALYSEKKWK